MKAANELLLVAALVLASTAAVAAYADTAPHTYQACYRTGGNKAGTVKLIGEPGTPSGCASGSTPFSFDAQGQPGPQGDPGPQGAPGSAGRPRPAGCPLA